MARAVARNPTHTERQHELFSATSTALRPGTAATLSRRRIRTAHVQRYQRLPAMQHALCKLLEIGRGRGCCDFLPGAYQTTQTAAGQAGGYDGTPRRTQWSMFVPGVWPLERSSAVRDGGNAASTGEHAAFKALPARFSDTKFVHSSKAWANGSAPAFPTPAPAPT